MIWHHWLILVRELLRQHASHLQQLCSVDEVPFNVSLPDATKFIRSTLRYSRREQTRLPSNLRLNTCEVRAFSYGHFRSRDKDDGHTIRSAAAENPMLHANFTALCSMEPELQQIEVLHCTNGNFRPVSLLWPWPWPHDLHIRTWSSPWRCAGWAKMNVLRLGLFETYHLTDRHTYIHTYIQTDRQTDRQTETWLSGDRIEHQQ